MEKTKMHMVAGILTIVAAGLKLSGAFGLVIAIFAVGNNPALHSLRDVPDEANCLTCLCLRWNRWAHSYCRKTRC